MKITHAPIALALFFLALSCKKDNTPNTETPLQTFIKTSIVVDTTIIQKTTGSFEFGNKFYASRNGVITHLGCYLPYKGSIRVSLWDFATKNLITATSVTSDSTGFVYVDIPDVPIVANQRYVISLNNNSGSVARNYFFRYKKSAAGVSIYPLTSGSITFEGLFYSVSIVPEFPTISITTSLGGFPDFKFQ